MGAKEDWDNAKKEFDTNKKKDWVFALICVLFIVFFVFGTGYIFITDNGKSEDVQNIFVDVNGDGLLDLLLSGEVIYNSPAPLAVEQLQP